MRIGTEQLACDQKGATEVGALPSNDRYVMRTVHGAYAPASKWYEASRVNFMSFEEVRGRLVPVISRHAELPGIAPASQQGHRGIDHFGHFAGLTASVQMKQSIDRRLAAARDTL